MSAIEHCPSRCGGCSCHLSPPCNHCVEHIHDEDTKADCETCKEEEEPVEKLVDPDGEPYEEPQERVRPPEEERLQALEWMSEKPAVPADYKIKDETMKALKEGLARATPLTDWQRMGPSDQALLRARKERDLAPNHMPVKLQPESTPRKAFEYAVSFVTEQTGKKIEDLPPVLKDLVSWGRWAFAALWEVEIQKEAAEQKYHDINRAVGAHKERAHKDYIHLLRVCGRDIKLLKEKLARQERDFRWRHEQLLKRIKKLQPKPAVKDVVIDGIVQSVPTDKQPLSGQNGWLLFWARGDDFSGWVSSPLEDEDGLNGHDYYPGTAEEFESLQDLKGAEYEALKNKILARGRYYVRTPAIIEKAEE